MLFLAPHSHACHEAQLLWIAAVLPQEVGGAEEPSAS